jgi:hypothetical protein
MQYFRHEDDCQRRNDSDADQALGQAIVQNQAPLDGGKKKSEIHGWAASTGATM